MVLDFADPLFLYSGLVWKLRLSGAAPGGRLSPQGETRSAVAHPGGQRKIFFRKLFYLLGCLAAITAIGVRARMKKRNWQVYVPERRQMNHC